MRIKAVGLLSGGLDSTLAARVLLDQDIDIYGINFTSPFCTCTSRTASCSAVQTAVRQLGDLPLKRVKLGDDYLDIVKNPRFGYGAGMNPCLDCRIMKIKKSGVYMEQIGAAFLFTGEVLGQRPMSQHMRALETIDRASGLKGLILRPLSARYLEPTIPELKGWVDREKLLGLQGRTRKPQIALAAEKGITEYPCPAGGCRLTDKHFAARLRDYFLHESSPSMRDIPLLKIGRHFRFDHHDRVVVARDEPEGEALQRLAGPEDHLFVPRFSAPVTWLRGTAVREALEKMIAYTNKTPPSDARIEYFHGKEYRDMTLTQCLFTPFLENFPKR